MLEDCQRCFFVALGFRCILLGAQGKYCHINFAEGEYQKDCPLIEVKEPHGRLIDADKLYYKTMSDTYFDIRQIDGMEKAKPYLIAMKDVDNAPTVIESEGE